MNTPNPLSEEDALRRVREEFARFIGAAGEAEKAGRESSEVAAESARAALDARLSAFPEEHFSPGGTLGPRLVAAEPMVQATPPPEPVVLRPNFASPPSRPSSWRWLAAAAAVVLAGVLAWSMRGPGELLRDGPLVVRADGSVVWSGAVSTELRDAVASVLKERSAAALLGAFGPTRSGASDPAPSAAPVFALEPEPDSAVESLQPVLRWVPPPGAGRCRVVVESVTEPGAAGPTAQVELPGATPTWQITAPLVRGGIYQWRVSALAADSRVLSPADSAGAFFKVLDEAALARVAQARQTAGGSHLLLGVAYAREGLRAEARREFQALRAADPKSDLAQALAESAKR